MWNQGLTLVVRFLSSLSLCINHSINQSDVYRANIPDEARLSGMTAESVFNSKIDETVAWHQQAVGYAGV